MSGGSATWRNPDLAALAAAEIPGRAPPSSGAQADRRAPPHDQAPQPNTQRTGMADAPLESSFPDTPEALRDWTRAIGQGDEAAFARFYDLYSQRLYRHLLVVARGREDDAREVLQAVVLKLAKRFEIFDDERRLWAWLCRLGRNACIDHWRALQRDRRFVSLEEGYAHAQPPAPETAPASGLDQDQGLMASLHRALDRLTAEERELVRAAYVDGCPLQELADAGGQTYKAVESRLARLRRKLKANLLNHLRHENGS